MNQVKMTDEQPIEQAGMPVIIKVLAFMFLLVLVFTGVAHLVPQMEGQAPKDVEVDLGSLTMAGYIAMGETLFRGKGTCTLCHNNLGRAPDILLMDMQATADERINHSEYRGNAQDSENYLRESMIDPSKYVVPGYGKPGEPSPMPAIDKAPIGLSKIEMGAIIAYLQAKDGGQPTVELPSDAPAVEQPKTVAAVEAAKPASNAEAVLSKYGCTACHAVLDSVSAIGPELNSIGARSSKEAIRESIINPAAIIVEGFPPIMPADFADKMMVKELELVVDYLYAAKGEVQKTETSAAASSEENQPIETEQKGE